MQGMQEVQGVQGTGRDVARPDTRDMVAVHQLFRREFRLVAKLVRACDAGDVGRAAVLAAHARGTLHALHVHHTGEDELLWPILLARAPLDEAAVERARQQHEALAARIEIVEIALDAWAASAAPADGDKLAAALDTLNASLTEHLDEEEKRILPLAGRHLTVAEWARLGEHGVKHTPVHRRMLILGGILEELPADERVRFAAHLPAPVRLLWAAFGRRQYERYIGRVRGVGVAG